MVSHCYEQNLKSLPLRLILAFINDSNTMETASSKEGDTPHGDVGAGSSKGGG